MRPAVRNPFAAARRRPRFSRDIFSLIRFTMPTDAVSTDQPPLTVDELLRRRAAEWSQQVQPWLPVERLANFVDFIHRQRVGAGGDGGSAGQHQGCPEPMAG